MTSMVRHSEAEVLSTCGPASTVNLPFVVSIILNYNRRPDTLECLASLAAGSYLNHHTIVLDACSSDNSVSAIRNAFPDVEIIELTENLGYAGNNNIGLKAALERRADWVFLLNEDTVLAGDCLEQLVNVAESDPRIGIVGPMVYHHDEPEVIQSAGGCIGRCWESYHLAQNELDVNQFVEPHAVDWISGCAILVRRQLIEQIDGIDPQYFLYWEETEWCLRARKAGWKAVHVPRARLWHKGVQRNYNPAPSVTYYLTRNRLLTMAKQRVSISTWIRVWLWIVRTLASWTLRPKWKPMRVHRKPMVRGVVDFFLRRWGGPVRL